MVDAKGGESSPSAGGAGSIRGRSEEDCVNWQRTEILLGLQVHVLLRTNESDSILEQCC